MKRVLSLFAAAAMIMATGCSHQVKNSSRQTPASENAPESSVAANRPEALDRLDDSAKVLDELMNAPDNAIPETVLANAKCVMVIPSMIKGGFIVGGRHGRGVVTCRNNKAGSSWTSPAFVTLTGGSWGAQIGAQAVDLVLVFMNQKGVDALMKNNFKLGADASVSAGPLGRTAQAATDASIQSEILSYSRSRGLFAGLELSGASVRRDDDSMKGFYGRDVSIADAINGNVQAPASASNFLSTVRKDFRDAKASQ